MPGNLFGRRPISILNTVIRSNNDGAEAQIPDRASFSIVPKHPTHLIQTPQSEYPEDDILRRYLSYILGISVNERIRKFTQRGGGSGLGGGLKLPNYELPPIDYDTLLDKHSATRISITIVTHLYRMSLKNQIHI
jgi:hypothetical protein